MKNLNFLFTIFLMVVFVYSCQDDDQEFGDILTPNNLNISIDIEGVDAANPNGDGSGKVNFTATADNHIALHYIIQGERILADVDGKTSYRFTELGLNTYEITVIAYGTGGASSSMTVLVDVLSEFEAPAAVLSKIAGKTLRIKSEVGGHFGLGPVGGETPGEWFSAGANDKAGTGMYDDQYIFNEDGTFTHVTGGTVFGREVLINELGGSGGDQNGADIENYVLDDYQASWSLIPLEGNGIALRLTGTAFIGYYTGGNHIYELFNWDDANQLASNDFILRTTDGNNEFDWWFIVTSDE